MNASSCRIAAHRDHNNYYQQVHHTKPLDVNAGPGDPDEVG